MINSGRRFELFFWSALPAIITFLLMILFLVAKHLGGLNHFMPVLPLIPIFYWGMMQARDMPYWFVFFIGLVIDSVTGLPPGLSSLLYLFFLAMLHVQRKYIHKEGFVIKWGYFAALLAVTGSLQWIILSLYLHAAMTLTPAFIQWLLTVCCYPFLHKSFDQLYDHIHSRRWQILHGH